MFLQHYAETISNLFEGSEIRSIWNSEEEEYYYSVVDVIAALTNSDYNYVIFVNNGSADVSITIDSIRILMWVTMWDKSIGKKKALANTRA